MAEEAAAEAEAPLLHGLLDEIVLWEILVLLDPKSLLRCRAVRRAWRCTTSTRRFLLAHHARQPALHIVLSDGSHNILAFDHRAAQLRTVVRLDDYFHLHESCDGLLLLSRSDTSDPRIRYLTVWNPATREHASLGVLRSNFRILGMYPHRPTGEYRLLLSNFSSPEGQIGCYVLPLGSNQPPRYIERHLCPGTTEMATDMVYALVSKVPPLIHDSLHWFLLKHSKHVLVFDTTAESFRHMRAPVVLGGGDPGLFEMDGTLGIHSLHDATGIVNIWVLQDYESEVWEFKYRIKMPVAEIREQFGDDDESSGLGVVSWDGDVLLLLNFGGWLLQVDSDGKLIESFDCGHRDLWIYEYRLKQSLVQHTIFPALKSYAGSASPLI